MRDVRHDSFPSTSSVLDRNLTIESPGVISCRHRGERGVPDYVTIAHADVGDSRNSILSLVTGNGWYSHLQALGNGSSPVPHWRKAPRPLLMCPRLTFCPGTVKDQGGLNTLEVK